MKGDKIIQPIGKYTCYACLKMSSNPDVCTHCGAEIGGGDINEAIFKPPEMGEYVVPLNFFSEADVHNAIGEVSNLYFNSLNVASRGIDQLRIVSSDIAYERFVQVLSNVSGIALDQLQTWIKFVPFD
ncbi:hypothetical protein SAMN02745857_02742 [Andreprevotia lacus DSM 23236]|jgi:hypothetical protein|uniref:Uncharacterized protein n=1 Tax=Andreprevotia lacus DSM 23236 TaxID=1121001 RepID=A0A1W1XTH1_9NEIS|nr:hypothetical protein [Andreprevotia lacus]SMC27186.1 hypothetical protein SAMN02745857_02742 [Andreprevotia lacus DSM 23236]